MFDVKYQKKLARMLLSQGAPLQDLDPEPGAIPGEAALLAASAELLAPTSAQKQKVAGLEYPDGLVPEPRPFAAPPPTGGPLWKIREGGVNLDYDVLVITWTVAELEALADIFTPGYPRNKWYPYAHRYDEYVPKIRERAPAIGAGRLGSYFPTNINGKRVLCFKSELHLNQDGIRLDGEDPVTGARTTLPVYDLILQLIRESGAKYVFTTGTSGGIFADHDLGDVVVTRGAKFRCNDEFEDARFNGKSYRSEWVIPSARLQDAERLMRQFMPEVQDYAFAPPTKRFPFEGAPIEAPPNRPDIKLDGKDFAEYHPILTTDFFEFGTSANAPKLQLEGCALDMGDAVLGLVCEHIREGRHNTSDQPPLEAPRWAVLRNLSDPQINGDLAYKMQAHWAVWYYEEYGYWTSVCGALATWGLIAGL